MTGLNCRAACGSFLVLAFAVAADASNQRPSAGRFFSRFEPFVDLPAVSPRSSRTQNALPGRFSSPYETLLENLGSARPVRRHTVATANYPPSVEMSPDEHFSRLESWAQDAASSTRIEAGNPSDEERSEEDDDYVRQMEQLKQSLSSSRVTMERIRICLEASKSRRIMSPESVCRDEGPSTRPACEHFIRDIVRSPGLLDYLFPRASNESTLHKFMKLPVPSALRFYVRLLKQLKKRGACPIALGTDAENRAALAAMFYLDESASPYWVRYYCKLGLTAPQAISWTLALSELVQPILQYARWFVKFRFRFGMLNEACRSDGLCRRLLRSRMAALPRAALQGDPQVASHLAEYLQEVTPEKGARIIPPLSQELARLYATHEPSLVSTVGPSCPLLQAPYPLAGVPEAVQHVTADEMDSSLAGVPPAGGADADAAEGALPAGE
ncbi:transmembrane protein, partial [Cystoisospora suis]